MYNEFIVQITKKMIWTKHGNMEDNTIGFHQISDSLDNKNYQKGYFYILIV